MLQHLWYMISVFVLSSRISILTLGNHYEYHSQKWSYIDNTLYKETETQHNNFISYRQIFPWKLSNVPLSVGVDIYSAIIFLNDPQVLWFHTDTNYWTWNYPWMPHHLNVLWSSFFFSIAIFAPANDAPQSLKIIPDRKQSHEYDRFFQLVKYHPVICNNEYQIHRSLFGWSTALRNNVETQWGLRTDAYTDADAPFDLRSFQNRLCKNIQCL